MCGYNRCTTLGKPPKRKRRESWNIAGHSHFLTFSTLRRHQYLLDERICEFLVESIEQAALKHHFVLFAYVFMPDHVHLLIHPLDEQYDMAKILQSIKQGPARKAKNRSYIPGELWEPGGGYDSNLISRESKVSCIGYIHFNPVRKDMVENPWDYPWSSADWHVHGNDSKIKCTRMYEVWED